MGPDAVLFLVSQAYLSGKRFKALRAGLIAACAVPAAVVRMEGRDAGPMTALDGLVEDGARSILVQPAGIPLSDSLAAWLPNALAYWQRQRGHQDVTLRLANDQVENVDVLWTLARSALENAGDAVTVEGARPTIDGAGWDRVPGYKHHLLVCTGPRCTYREAGLLGTALSEELSKAGMASDCLIATTGCLFPCNKGPVLVHYPSGRWYGLKTRSDLERFVTTVLKDGQSLPDLIIHEVTP